MATKTALRVDDLLTLPALPEGQWYELSKGELIIVGSAGYLHELVKSRILELLVAWNLEARLGRILGDSMFKLFDDTARIPDVAFVSHERMAAVPVNDAIISFVPELAVEVISKSEGARDAENKVHEYLSSGVEEVWQFFPENRIVHVRTANGIRQLAASDPLTSPLLPGFSVPVSMFFD